MILLIVETILKVVAVAMTIIAAVLFVVTAAEMLGDGGDDA